MDFLATWLKIKLPSCLAMTLSGVISQNILHRILESLRSQNPSGFYLGLKAEVCSWFCENREKSINDTPA